MTCCALVILDWDGTLTSLRLSPVHDAPLIVLPNVVAKLATLSAEGVALALATNQVTGEYRSRPYTNAIINERLDELARLFPMIPRGLMRVGRPGTGDWKPSPGMLISLLRETEIKRQDALFVGDSESDQKAAENAGIGFVWAWDYFNWPNGRAGCSIDWKDWEARGNSLWRKNRSLLAAW